MKTLIILSAMPGSGKSTWAKKYQEEHPNTFIVSSDAIRYEITGTMQDFSRQKEVWALFSSRIHEYAQKQDDVVVILDALNDLDVLRTKYVKENPEYDRYELVLFPRTREQIKFYNQQRAITSVVPDDQLEILMAKWEEPSPEVLSLFDEVHEIRW